MQAIGSTLPHFSRMQRLPFPGNAPAGQYRGHFASRDARYFGYRDNALNGRFEIPSRVGFGLVFESEHQSTTKSTAFNF